MAAFNQWMEKLMDKAKKQVEERRNTQETEERSATEEKVEKRSTTEEQVIQKKGKENKRKIVTEEEQEEEEWKKFFKRYRLIMILFGVLLGVGGGGLGSFYPKNVETALDTLINTKTGMKSINIQPDIENINTTLPDNFTACATSCPAAECRKKNARTTARLTPKIIFHMSCPSKILHY